MKFKGGISSMYYNRIIKIWVLDPYDYLLIGAFIRSLLASYLKNYFSEKAAMERLKNSLIQESPLLKIPGSKVRPNFDSRKSKIKRIYKFALDNRVGDLNYDQAEQVLGSELVQAIQTLILKLAHFLKEQELRGVLRVLFRNGRLVLQLILYTFKIRLEYTTIEGVNAQIIVVAFTTGAAGGFVGAWVQAGAMIATPPVLMLVFLLRSISIGQQIIHLGNMAAFKRMSQELLDYPKIRGSLEDIIIEANKKIDANQKIYHSNKIILENLNWNKNSAIKEAAEQLGIFENSPDLTGDLSLDLSNPETDQILEEFGIIKNPIGDYIDVEAQDIVKESVKIRNPD
jgi:hypothetical protein